MKKYTTLEAISAIAKDKNKVFETITCINTKEQITSFYNGSQLEIGWLRTRETLSLTETVMGYEWELIQEPVDFLTAVKAYSEGKTIRCELNGMVPQTYKPLNFGEYKSMKSQINSAISAKEILYGTWTIVEDSNE
jgi:hypothetical protein